MPRGNSFGRCELIRPRSTFFFFRPFLFSKSLIPSLSSFPLLRFSFSFSFLLLLLLLLLLPPFVVTPRTCSRPFSYFLSLGLSPSLQQPVISMLSSPLLEYLRLEISYILRVRFTSDNSTINTIGRELASIASRLERPSSLGFRRIRFKKFTLDVHDSLREPISISLAS